MLDVGIQWAASTKTCYRVPLINEGTLCIRIIRWTGTVEALSLRSAIHPAEEGFMTRLTLYGASLWALGISFVAGAAILTLNDIRDHNWLPQAGCLLVMLGIWSSVGGLILERLAVRSLRIRYGLLIAQARLRYTFNKPNQDKLKEALQGRLEERLHAAQSTWRFSIGSLEASLLVVGTPLWGFGELLPLG
jgi:hypothetical protein